MGTIQEIFGKGRLVKAEALIQQGNARAAILETSIYFEHALRELFYRNEAKFSDILRGRRPERLSMGEMLEHLSKLDVVSHDDVPKIRECIILRNRTVHDLAEPKLAGAKSFIEVASDFVKKYLGEDFNGK